MTTLYFSETKHQIYRAIKWAATNSEDKETREICNMALADGCPSSFGYSLKVNEFWAIHIIQAQAEYLRFLESNK